MQLYIMRHGQANPMGNIDHLRELTPAGYKEAQCMGKWFNQQALPLIQVFVSPYVRAQQTANAVLDEINGQVKRETINFITPLDDAKKVHDYLDGMCSEHNYQKILLVSHMPLVSYLVAELSTDNAMPIFQTASVAQIDYDKERMQGQFIGLVSPDEM